MTGTTKVILIVLVCVGVLVLTCVGGGIALVLWLGEEPENIVLQVDAPLTVQQGQDFTIKITVSNTAPTAQKLHSIDIWDEYVQGIAIRSTEPAFTQSYHVPVDNTQAFEFYLDIPPQDSITITFDATAVAPGDYNSFFDACINSDVNFLTHPLRTIVE